MTNLIEPPSNTEYCAMPGCGRRQSVHMLPQDSNRTAWINFISNEVPADEVKHRRLFASFHWGLFCKQDTICKPIKSKIWWCSVYIGSDRNCATHRLWVESFWSPFYNIGRFENNFLKVHLLVSSKSLYYAKLLSTQHLSKSSVWDAHKKLAFFMKAHNLGTN